MVNTFRAYIKDENRVVPVYRISFDGGFIFAPSKKNKLYLETYYLNEFIMMRYVGVYDKEGVGIYEGDIVEYTISSGYHYNKIFYGVVSYDNRNAAFTLGDGPRNSRGKKTVLFTRAKNKRVIGNIYENPELLQKVEE